MKPIPNYPNYSITENGNVYSNRYNKWLKPIIENTGYLSVDLGHRNKCAIHRLVLETFIGPCPKGMECCHNDGDRHNNKLENLRWDTRSNNIKDAQRHGTFVSLLSGENHNKAKLSVLDVQLIRAGYKLHLCKQKELAKLFGVGDDEISRIVNYKIWRGVADLSFKDIPSEDF